MHDDATRPQWRFSLRDLLIAVGCVSLILAALVPFFRKSIELARTNHCEHNLLRLGLATHNFHDTFNGIPPLGIGEGRPSLFVQVMIFTDDKSSYQFYCALTGRNALGNTVFSHRLDGPTGNWALLNAVERNAAFQPYLRCPGRGRPQPSFVMPSDSTYFGPTSDYAVVFFGGRQRDAPYEFRAFRNWEDHYDSCDPQHVARQWGAIRLADVDCSGTRPNYAAWKPRDTFARVTDGMSMTLIFGEKYVRRAEMHLYADDVEKQDGTYLFEANARRSASVTRNMWFPLASDESDPRFRPGKKTGPQRDFSFGGPHTGGILFGVADGSVKVIHRQAAQEVLYRYAHCQDELIGTEFDGPIPLEDFSLDDPKEPPVAIPDR